jgi:trehalose 6-phosphate synthase
MNLVVKEWAIASERPGAAIISETAGVASDMGASALLISPLDIEGTAEAMSWALDMPMPEREARLVRLRRQAESWTAGHWLSAQLDALHIARTVENGVITAVPTQACNMASPQTVRV